MCVKIRENSISLYKDLIYTNSYLFYIQNMTYVALDRKWGGGGVNSLRWMRVKFGMVPFDCPVSNNRETLSFQVVM